MISKRFIIKEYQFILKNAFEEKLGYITIIFISIYYTEDFPLLINSDLHLLSVFTMLGSRNQIPLNSS